MSWTQSGNKDSMCIYWTNRTQNESQIVIMNNTEFYALYPELNKHYSKTLGYELSVTPQYSDSCHKIIITNDPSFELVYNLAQQIINENPNGILFNYSFKKILLKSDKYRHTNHFIKNRDLSKFSDHEIGDRGVLLTKYFGAIDKASMLNVTVYRPEGKEYKPIMR